MNKLICYGTRLSGRLYKECLRLAEENERLKEENNKLEIALQNIQEDYDRRLEEIDVLKKKLDRRYYKNECKRLEQENERLKVNCNLGYEDLKVARDYKSRCEKAIECLNKRKNEVNEDLWVEMRAKDYFEECDEIINILQNGSDSQ